MSEPTPWSAVACALFAEAAKGSGLSDVDLAARLSEELGRGKNGLSRQTISAWRRGHQTPPSSATWATMKIGSTTVTEVLAGVLLRNPEFINLLVIPMDDASRARYSAARAALNALVTRHVERLQSQGHSPNADEESQAPVPELDPDQQP